MQTRTYWLSFCDDRKPVGTQFLGACIVTVTDAEAAQALAMFPEMYDKIEGPWVGAAMRKAWELKCNPGGTVASWRIDNLPDADTRLPHFQQGVLMSRVKIDKIEAEIDRLVKERTT